MASSGSASSQPPRPIEIVAPDPSWPAQFDELAARIRDGLGDRVLAVEHVGSTSVPGLAAKPIIDIDVTVADSRDESSYVPDLEAAGFTPSAPRARLARAPTAGARIDPRANVHVFGPDSPELVRHRMLRDWLIEHPDDRERYAAAKRDAGRSRRTVPGEEVMAYNQRKEPVIRDILDRMFRAHGLL